MSSFHSKQSISERFHLDPLFLRTLRWLITLTVAVTLTLSMTLFITFEKITRSHTYDSALNLLDQTAASTEDLITNIEQIAFQIQQDKTISPILYQADPTSGEEQVAIDQLSRYQYIIKSLSSIYIYNGRSNTWYTSSQIDDTDNLIIRTDDFPDLSAVQLIQNWENYPPYTAIPRKNGTHCYYTFICYGISHKSSSGELNYAVLVNVESSWLSGVLGSDTQNGETAVIDSEGLLLSNSDAFPMQSNLTKRIPEAESILGSNKGGSLIIKKSDTVSEKSLLVYTAADESGWQYIRLIPYRLITKPIDHVRNLTLVILAGFLLLGLIACWVLNHIFYQPVAKFKEDIEKLETSERENHFVLKNACLTSILLSSSTDVSHQIKKYHLNLNPEKKAIVAAIFIDHFIPDLNERESSAIRYAILNIAQEIIPTPCEGVDLNKDWNYRCGKMALIITPETTLSEEEQRTIYQKICEAVEKALNFTISIGVSRPGNFDELSFLFETAVENCFQKLFTGDGSVFIGGHDNRITDYHYPEKKEKACSDALLHGNYDKACSIYLEIIEEIRGAPLYIVNTTVLRLASMCNQTASILPSLRDGHPFFINLSLFESIEDLNEAFFGFFRTITDAVQTQAGSKNNQLALKVDEEIKARFSDSCLSIDSLADTMGLSPSYLGRVYKSVTGKTILDKILSVRMDEARRLLKDSSLSVAEISEACGFSSDSYFYKLFRQENGMTPAAFRKAK